MYAIDCYPKMTTPAPAAAWKASRGFGSALALVFLAFCENEGLRIGYRTSPAFADWVRAHWHLVEVFVRLLRGLEWICVAYFFSSVRSINVFARETGLRQRLTPAGWSLAWVAMGVGLLQLFATQVGWSKEHPSVATFSTAGEFYWSFFVVYSILVVPFFEETVLRGFLYRSFRGSYGVGPSTILVLCVAIYFHWGLVKANWVSLVVLMVGGSVLCIMREYTGSTWNCVLFHAAYNATVIRQWPTLIVVMLILLLLRDRHARGNHLPQYGSTRDSADCKSPKQFMEVPDK
jgi:membrane protease YdiL (CAAX protease family)